MPRQLISLKRHARATPPKPYIPKPATESKATLAQQFTATKKKAWEPRTTETNQQKIFRRQQEALATSDKPHFRVGNKQLYFPQAKLTLLRPSAKHTPYQAKFIVPRKFNKLDLRDYLWHVYGLRALNVTTQLLWGRWQREAPGRPRYRAPQIKKMTIEMEHPFVWPEPTPEKAQKKQYRIELNEELRKYAEDVDRLGSDKLKPPKSFGGIVGPYAPAPEPFVSKRVSRQMANKKVKAEKYAEHQKDVDLVKQFLKL